MKWILTASSAFLLSLCGSALTAQAVPTASRTFQVSAFGGLNGTYTGLFSGRNLGITAGVDLGIRPMHSFYPSFEVRGTYPVDKGKVDSEKNILGGLRVAKTYGYLRPYADLLFGRGQINYGTGYPTPDNQFYYVQSISNVFSPGAGIDVQLTDQFSVKADGQFQRYSSPITDSGHVYSKALTLSIVYRFPFERKKR